MCSRRQLRPGYDESSTRRRPRRSVRQSGTVGNEDSASSWTLLFPLRALEVRGGAGGAFTKPVAMDVVVVNPSSVQGPGRATGTGKILLDLIAGRLSTVVDTRISIVDIDDCARGHILAASQGAAGRRYILNSFSMTIQEAVGLLASVIDRPLRVKYLPAPVALVGGTVIGAAYRLVGKQAPVCREMVRTLVHGHVYDGSRAARELGLDYTPATETLTAPDLVGARREPHPVTPAEVDRLVAAGFPAAYASGYRCEEMGEGWAIARWTYDPATLRPGGYISGPTLFGLADLAFWFATFTVLGPAPMAVTSDLSIAFLRPALGGRCPRPGPTCFGSGRPGSMARSGSGSTALRIVWWPTPPGATRRHPTCRCEPPCGLGFFCGSFQLSNN